MGIFDALTTSVAACGAVLRAGKHLRQYRELADRRPTSASTPASSISFRSTDLDQPGRRRRDGAIALHQHRRRATVPSTSVATNMAINGAGFFTVQKPGDLPTTCRCSTASTNYTRRGDFQLESQRLSRQRRRILSARRVRSTRRPAIRSATCRRFCSSRTISCRRRRPPRSTMRANLPTIRRPRATTPPSPGSELLASVRSSPPASIRRCSARRPTPYTDATTAGTGAINKAAVRHPITGATALSGAAGSNSISAEFRGQRHHHGERHRHHLCRRRRASATSSTSPTTSPTMLTKIDSITGTAHPLHRRRRRDHAAYRYDLRISTVTSSNATAFAALGFTGTVTATRGGGGTAGTGSSSAATPTTFANESISGGAVTAYDATGTPVNLQLRWAKTDSATLGVPHTDTWNLFYQSNPNATGTQTAPGSTPAPTLSSAPTDRCQPVGIEHHAYERRGQQSSLGNLTVNFGTRRPHPVRQCRRHHDHQSDPAGRLCRRPTSDRSPSTTTVSWSELFQRPESQSRGRLVVALQRHQLPEAARRRRLCRDR